MGSGQPQFGTQGISPGPLGRCSTPSPGWHCAIRPCCVSLSPWLPGPAWPRAVRPGPLSGSASPSAHEQGALPSLPQATTRGDRYLSRSNLKMFNTISRVALRKSSLVRFSIALATRSRLASCSSSMSCSKVRAATSRITVTGRVWPRRWTRSTAWSSIIGFHQGSAKTTWSAWTRFNPTPPAFREHSSTRGPSLAPKRSTATRLSCARMLPSSRANPTPTRVRAWAIRLRKEVNWEKITTLCGGPEVLCMPWQMVTMAFTLALGSPVVLEASSGPGSCNTSPSRTTPRHSGHDAPPGETCRHKSMHPRWNTCPHRVIASPPGSRHTGQLSSACSWSLSSSCCVAASPRAAAAAARAPWAEDPAAASNSGGRRVLEQQSIRRRKMKVMTAACSAASCPVLCSSCTR
mmetsp:Transcript_131185/g.298663  ORF Transcript_131185/g.298663 Transcript_131185/m.298663 type:complete len:406 (+) Transcript_131185:367-1584(+)